MKSHIRIVGAGLIGTSIGLKVVKLGHPVSMLDVNPQSQGLSRALMGRWSRVEENPSMVIVAVPPSATARVIKEQQVLYPESIVVETSSTKTNLELELRDLSVDLSRIVLSHPISGREVNGPSAARADLFLNRAWIVSPLQENPEGVLRAVEDLILSLGSTPYRMSAQEHDELLATTSHLPQVLSTVLASKAGKWGSRASLAGQGLRDMTRLADSDAKLWVEILRVNEEAVTQTLQSLIQELGRFKQAIEVRDESTIEDFFTEGKNGRSLISGKHGAIPRNYTQCQIVVPDQPGALARIFDICHRHSINIEDISLEHSPAQETGLLTVSISPDQENTLDKALIDSSFVFYFKEKK